MTWSDELKCADSTADVYEHSSWRLITNIWDRIFYGKTIDIYASAHSLCTNTQETN